MNSPSPAAVTAAEAEAVGRLVADINEAFLRQLLYDGVGDLAAALAKAQGKITAQGPILQSEVVEIWNRAGDELQYTYSYATLAAVLDRVLPAFAECELAWSTLPTVLADPEGKGPGRFVLRYVLLHSSGQWLGGDYPLGSPAENAQTLGGRISYAARYTIGRVASVATDKDTDAAGDSRAGRDAARDGDLVREERAIAAIDHDPDQRPAVRIRAGDADPEGGRWADQGEPPEDQPGSVLAVPGILRGIAAAFTKAGVTDDDQRHAQIEEMIGGPLDRGPHEGRTMRNLSLNEGKDVLRRVSAAGWAPAPAPAGATSAGPTTPGAGVPDLREITRSDAARMWARFKAVGTDDAEDAKDLLTIWLQEDEPTRGRVTSTARLTYADLEVINRKLGELEEAEAQRAAQNEDAEHPQ